MSNDLLCLSHLRWGFVHQRPNHLMLRWARDHRVFFFEEPTFADQKPHITVQHIGKGLTIVVPRLPDGERDPERVCAGLLERFRSEERIDHPIVWMYTPMALPVLGKAKPRALVYDCMDELAHFIGAPPILREREKELFRRADLVFTGGHSLYEAKRDHHPSVHAFPSSVDRAHFAKARAITEDPPDQAGIPHPRFGFYGVIDERMDLELLRGIAEARPDVQLVMIGPVVKIDPGALPRRPNIHWLGQKSYDELPHYLAGWDVAIMPFARNDATKFISPTKTLEFLAADKPIVSTSIRDVVRPYGERGLVRVADEPGPFVTAAFEALAEHDRARAEREAWLDGTSWDATFAKMRALVDRVLASPKRPEHREETVPCSTI